MKGANRSWTVCAVRIVFVGIIILLAGGCAGLPYRAYTPYSPERGDPQAQQEAVHSVIQRMSLRDRIAQRFILYIPREMVPSEVDAYIGKLRPAGVILYRWNYESLEDLVQLTEAIQRGYPETFPRPFICADQEGGRVQAFRFKEFAQMPSPFHLGTYRDTELVRSAAYITAVQMREARCTMNLAPVLDLVDTGDTSIIGDRSFGPDPEWVAKLTEAYLEGMKQGGIIPVVKHFPGHGVTRIDSHSQLPVVSVTEEELLKQHIVPFQAAIAAGAPVVMTAHILYPEIDPLYPATLSRKIIQDILRKKLKFQGVVMSDGLEMGALAEQYPVKETLRAALKAGVDLILLYTRYNLEDMITLVEELLQEGAISQRDINEGLERILALKQAYDLLPPSSITLKMTIELEYRF